MEFNSKKLKRKEGNISIFFTYMFLLIIVAITSFTLATNKINLLKNQAEDALIASSLAAATVDLETYAKEGLVVNVEIKGVKDSYNAFIRTFKENLDLNDNLVPKNESILKKVKIEKFIIYSDVGTHIQVNDLSNGYINSYQMPIGSTTENGKKIQDTMIYTKASFNIHMGAINENPTKENLIKVTEKDKDAFKTYQAKLENEKLEKERLEKEKLEKEKQEQERLEKEKLEKEKQEQEKLEKEKLEKEKQEQEKLEQERLEKEKQEQEKLENNLDKVE